MKIRGIQFGPALGNITKNFDFHKQKIAEAQQDGIRLIVFPELSLSGYHLQDIAYEVAVTRDNDMLKELAELSRHIDILVGAPFEEMPGIVYNSALYFSRGELLHNHKKTQLPNFGMFKEAMIFKAGDTFRTFKIGDFTAGIVICREILFPTCAYLYYLQGVDFLIGISNSPYRGMDKEGSGSLRLWERLGEVYAVNYHQNYVFVNRSGFEDGMAFGGGSFFAAAGRGITKKAAYFEEDILDFEINMGAVRASRLGANYLRDEKPGLVYKELERILNA